MSITEFENGQKLPLVEDFYTIQGEGFHAGKPAYFIRVAGCNVGCSWCDAKYSWNPKVHPLVDVDTIIQRVVESQTQVVVITGGEPLLYKLDYITAKIHDAGLQTFIETSGSSKFSGCFDWICLSPKKKLAPLDEIYPLAHELKVIIESEADFIWAEHNADKVSKNCKLFLQVEWSCAEQMMLIIVEYVKSNPKWNISIQTHKYMNIP